MTPTATDKFTWTASPEAEGTRIRWRQEFLSVVAMAAGLAIAAALVVLAVTAGPQREPPSGVTNQATEQKTSPSLALSGDSKEGPTTEIRESPLVVLLNPGSADPGYQRDRTNNDHLEAHRPAKVSPSKHNPMKSSPERMTNYLELRAYALGR